MDKHRLSEIRKRLAASTRGPWTTNGFDVHAPDAETVLHGDGSRPCIASAWSTASQFNHDKGRVQMKSGSQAANATFIAHSRDDVQVLLDALATAEANMALMDDAIRVLEGGLVDAEASLGGVHHTSGEKRCDAVLREARAILKQRTT